MRVYCDGFSLIEVLVAMLLGSLLLLTLVVVTSDLMRHVKLQQMLVNVLNRQRYVSLVLPQHMRQAGMSSCLDRHKSKTLAIRGYGADQASPHWLTQQLSHTGAVIISRCQNKQGEQQYLETAYYIAKTSHKDWMGHTLYGLYQKSFGGRRVELVSGIVDWVVRYGVPGNVNHTKTRYVAAADVSSWDQVSIVYFGIVFRSLFPVPFAEGEQVFFNHTYFVNRNVRYFSLPLFIALRSHSQ